MLGIKTSVKIKYIPAAGSLVLDSKLLVTFRIN
jgi:hypothetical protein